MQTTAPITRPKGEGARVTDPVPVPPARSSRGMWAEGDHDERLRSSAFAYLRSVQLRTGGHVRYEDMSEFRLDGLRVPLMDRQRGIRKPRVIDAALSFRTVHAARPDQRPYDDSPGADGYLRYKWRGTDPDYPENSAMRRALEEHRPLIWFRGVESGIYLPIFPVWLVQEEPSEHQFVVALDLEQRDRWTSDGAIDLALRRRYAERIIDDRLHQPLFRARILTAYGNRCAICRLGHSQLLDAAHIRSDADGGLPIVPNGISMCKIHHAAYDADILGIDPDYRVHIRRDVLDESDGPTLRHALQELNQSTLSTPSRRAAQPDRQLIGERFDRFRAAS
jgi:putative restriction endonuclease